MRPAGVSVDLLPATIPPGYQADAFIAIHTNGASGSLASTRRGWAVATPWRASAAAEALAIAIEQRYPAVTDLPADPRGASFDMRGYYAFSSFRFTHAIDPTTPAVIIECGYMTHPADRLLLFKQPQRVAEGIAQGVLEYLRARDPADSAARQPVALPALSATAALELLRQPDDASEALIEVPAGAPLVALVARGEWYLVTEKQTWEIGWVRASTVTVTS